MQSEIGYKGIIAKKPWVSDEMSSKMDKRIKWKNVITEEVKRKYKQLNNELRRETDKARERKVQNIEELDKRGILNSCIIM